MTTDAVATRQPRERRPTHPIALYEAALDGTDVVAVSSSGVRMLEIAAWTGEPDPVDELILARCEAPVLDVGCGPGRMVGALNARGVPALGIDVSTRAVEHAQARGALALRRAVEGPLPAEGRWGTVLLADGNIGIGGNPRALLQRCRDLVPVGGLVVVETDEDPDADESAPIELRAADGRTSRPMPWARVGSRALARIAAECGFAVVEEWHLHGRTVVTLRAS